MKLKCYTARVKQYQHNQTFKNIRKVSHRKLEGKVRQEQTMPDAEESTKFWKHMRDKPIDHNRNAQWSRAV